MHAGRKSENRRQGRNKNRKSSGRNNEITTIGSLFDDKGDNCRSDYKPDRCSVVTIDSGVVTIDSDILESRPTIDQFEHSFRYFNLSDSNFWTTDSPKYSSVRHSYPWQIGR